MSSSRRRGSSQRSQSLLVCAWHLAPLGDAKQIAARQDAEEGTDASGDDVTGEALFLTPLIKEGKLDEAKSKSKVGVLGADIEVPGFSGYITVNPQYNSNLFFWFVPSLSDPENAPVILWMQGGPGTTSMLGFFAENGPYILSADGAEIKTDVGRDMLEFLQQFFTLFGELAQNGLYLSGESYAGKYVPTVGATLHQNADTMRVKINFKGIAYGNGITDPINMLRVVDFIYPIGLMRMFFGIVTKEDTYFKNVTGYSYYYNYLTSTEPKGTRAYKVFLPKPQARRALHVGDMEFSITRDVVAGHFYDDFMRSAVPQFTEGA
ncbi:hypothetical protein MRX96_036262 [Rhipicephalus microplus]